MTPCFNPDPGPVCPLITADYLGPSLFLRSVVRLVPHWTQSGLIDSSFRVQAISVTFLISEDRDSGGGLSPLKSKGFDQTSG